MGFSTRTQSDNAHLANQTNANYVHIDGSTPQTVVRSTPGRLLRVVIGTAGIVAIIRSGSEVIGKTSATSSGTLNFGVWASTNITVDVVSGTGSLTVVHDK